MDPKELNRTDLNFELTSEVSQVNSPPFITSKSVLSATTAGQKSASSSLSSFNIPKILGRNCNGTMVLTSFPNNEAELQLYRVMQRASLLAYYDTLLEMGGDDLQQLCDAGNEEFLEIMALVGMASKPLHVRRLQKALQEWVASPALFQTPLPPSATFTDNIPTNVRNNPQIGSTVPLSPTTLTRADKLSSERPSPSEMFVSQDLSEVNSETTGEKDTRCLTPTNQEPTSPSFHSTQHLTESQILQLSETVKTLMKSLPHVEPKPHNAKKKLCRDLENVMNMTEEDPRRMEEIRKYAAIYGRFDCKRNPKKPLTLHEVSVNEAAAQICSYSPALLTRRDDLFSLARQVVRDSGISYIKGQSSAIANKTYHFIKNQEGDGHFKKRKLSDEGKNLYDVIDTDKLKKQERLEQIAEELRILGDKTGELVEASQKIRKANDLPSLQSLQQEMEIVQNKQTQLLVEQSELLKQPLPSRFYRRNGSQSSLIESEKSDRDDSDPPLSFSTSPSQLAGDSRDSLSRDGEIGGVDGESQSVRSPCKFKKQVGPK